MTFQVNKNAKEFLEKAGYTQHNLGRGFVRYLEISEYQHNKEENKYRGDVKLRRSRFHVIVKREWVEFGLDNEAVLDIHYDKDHGTYHSAALKYDKLVKEMRRIFAANGIIKAKKLRKQLGITNLP